MILASFRLQYGTLLDPCGKAPKNLEMFEDMTQNY